MESLTLGLDGTNPRFPWKPSATMLNYRLTGTTERIGVNHNELASIDPRQCRWQPQPAAHLRPPTVRLDEAPKR